MNEWIHHHFGLIDSATSGGIEDYHTDNFFLVVKQLILRGCEEMDERIESRHDPFGL